VRCLESRGSVHASSSARCASGGLSQLATTRAFRGPISVFMLANIGELDTTPGGWAAPSIADQRPLSGAKHSLASLKIATGLEGPVLYCSCDRRLTAPCGKRHGATGSSRKCVPWRRRPVVDCMDVLTKDLSKSSQSLNRTFATCHGRTAKDNIGEVKPSPETS